MTVVDTVRAATETILTAAQAAEQELATVRANLSAALTRQDVDAGLVADLTAQLAEARSAALQARRPRTGPRITTRRYEGDVILTDARPSVYGLDITGRIIARTARPSARHCIVRGGPAATAETTLIDSTSSVVKDFTIENLALEPSAPTVWTSGIKGHHFRASRTSFRRLCDGVQAFNTTAKGSDLQVTLEDFVMEAFFRAASDPRQKNGADSTHNDGCQWLGGYGLAILRGLIDLSTPEPVTGGSFSALMVNTSANVGPVGPSRMEDCDVRGGTTPINAGGVSGVDLGAIRRNTFDGRHTGTYPMVMLSTTKVDLGKGTGDANRFADGTEMLPKVYPG